MENTKDHNFYHILSVKGWLHAHVILWTDTIQQPSSMNKYLYPSKHATLKSGWIQRRNLVEICVDFTDCFSWIQPVKTCWNQRWNLLEIYGWNLVEIHVDFANCFWLYPTSEIMLKPTIEIWLYLWVKSGWNTCRFCKHILVGSNVWNRVEFNG